MQPTKNLSTTTEYSASDISFLSKIPQRYETSRDVLFLSVSFESFEQTAAGYNPAEALPLLPYLYSVPLSCFLSLQTVVTRTLQS